MISVYCRLDPSAGMGSMARTFRIRPAIQQQWLALTAFFVLALAGAVSLFFLDEPEAQQSQGFHTETVVWGMAVVVSGAFLALSLYILASARVEHAEVEGATLTMRSVFHRRQFSLREVSRLRWRVMPAGGSVVLHGACGRGRIEFAGYRRQDRLELIRLLREQVPQRAQEGWPDFCRQVALGVRDGPGSQLRYFPPEALIHLDRGRYRWILTVGVPLAALVAVLTWAVTGDAGMFLLPAVTFGFWLLLSWNVRGGKAEVRLLAYPGGNGVACLLGLLVALPLLMLVLGLAGLDDDTASVVILLVSLPAMAVGIRSMLRGEKSSRQVFSQRAVELWNAGEHPPAANTGHTP